MSVRCQIGCHGETWAYVTAADVTCSEDSALIGNRIADAPDGVASWLGLVLGDFRDMRTVNVNRRRECDFVTPWRGGA